MKRFLAALALLATPAQADIALPVHGNWCGPGHGAGPALDRLDAACLRHDLCIVAAGGPFNCACDLSFMQELRDGPWPNPDLRDRVRGVYEAITLIPCADAEGQAMKLRWAARDWLAAVSSGQEPATATFSRFARMAEEVLARSYLR